MVATTTLSFPQHTLTTLPRPLRVDVLEVAGQDGTGRDRIGQDGADKSEPAVVPACMPAYARRSVCMHACACEYAWGTGD